MRLADIPASRVYEGSICMQMWFHDISRMNARKAEARGGMYKAALHRLLADAKDALSINRLTVVDKPAPPPSGDMHDYYSIAPYYWPNPDTPDHLPYVGRDGEINPEFELCDRRRLDKIAQLTRTLALAYFLTDDEKYRWHAVKLLRCFFINEDTRMNPNMRYAQCISGICTGRGVGIIDLRYVYRLLDMITLLDDANLSRDMAEWAGNMQKWLTVSQYGKDEMAANNNHGTWYDVTYVSLALFTGAEADAARVFSEFAERRVSPQVASDGAQPRELKRTRSFLYSTLNLAGFFMAAVAAERAGRAIWGARGIRDSLTYMLPSYADYNNWKHKQIAENWLETWEQAYEALIISAEVYDMPGNRNIAKALYEKWIPDSDIVFLRA